MKRTAGEAFVVVGPPAVGKSTTARLLASTAATGVHVPVDALRDFVVSGLVLPGADYSEALDEQVRAARQVALAALTTYTELGFTVVLDDFLDPTGLLEYHEVVRSRRATGVVLRPDREVAIARARQREATPEGAAYICMGIEVVFSCLDEVLPRLTGLGWQVLDNTNLDPSETVAAILDLGRGRD
ncbi:AAA family ATPase [Terrabacter carboxydivorans]|uniref:AAA domain-containing protein n=1 Tax=Terrabacter carboxydivorans TaxID=619730 RepID=A0ABP5ZI27_9MICO